MARLTNLLWRSRQSQPDHALLNPVLAIGFASLSGCAVLAARIYLTGSWRHLYLPWNLFLAWLPLLFALAAGRLRHDARRWKFYAAAFAWLVFFPNAPYLLTDLTHLGQQTRPHW